MEFSDYSEKYSNIEGSFIILDSNKNSSLAIGEILHRPVFRLFTPLEGQRSSNGVYYSYLTPYCEKL